MTRYGMVVDLNRCVGCQTCTIACKQANQTPPGVQWRRVIDVEQGSFPSVERVFVVTGCQHCAKPPCVPVCPTGATRQRADGLVTIDYDICIGCAACAVACPYHARTIGSDVASYYEELTVQEQHILHEERIGVANKCTFCVGRIDSGIARGLTPGVDSRATPACAVSCIAQAIHFGDFADTNSNVSRMARENRTFQMHAQLDTDPQIRYIYEIPESMPGRASDPVDSSDEAMADPANPLVGPRQKFWDYRAAMNFVLGGMSSGLVIAAWLAYWGGTLNDRIVSWLYAVAAAIMAVGLLYVFLKIGRKARFLYVLLRPQTSWMSRETWCVAVFYPAVTANLVWATPTLSFIAAVAAAGFLISQAYILHASKGIPAWRAPLMPPMLMVTGLSEGVGLLVVAGAVSLWGIGVTPGMALAGLILTILNAGLWWRYRATAKAAGIGPLSRRELTAISPALHVLGHGVPAALYALALIPGPWVPVAGGLAGALTVAGGVYWKFCLVLRACHDQGFELPMIPQRGSGNRAAPERLARMSSAMLPSSHTGHDRSHVVAPS